MKRGYPSPRASSVVSRMRRGPKEEQKNGIWFLGFRQGEINRFVFKKGGEEKEPGTGGRNEKMVGRGPFSGVSFKRWHGGGIEYFSWGKKPTSKKGCSEKGGGGPECPMEMGKDLLSRRSILGGGQKLKWKGKSKNSALPQKID